MSDSIFWLEQPGILFKSLKILPEENMSWVERLNTITRLIIVLVLVMYMMSYRYWWLFFLITIIIVILLWQRKNMEPSGKESMQTPYTSQPYHRNEIVTPKVSQSTRSNIRVKNYRSRIEPSTPVMTNFSTPYNPIPKEETKYITTIPKEIVAVHHDFTPAPMFSFQSGTPSSREVVKTAYISREKKELLPHHEVMNTMIRRKMVSQERENEYRRAHHHMYSRS